MPEAFDPNHDRPPNNSEQTRAELQRLRQRIEAERPRALERVSENGLLTRQVLLRAGGSLFAAPNGGHRRSAEATTILHVLRQERHRYPGWLRVGSSDGSETGWVREPDIEVWNTRHALVIEPRSSLLGLYGPEQRSFMTVFSGDERVTLPMRQLQYYPPNEAESLTALRRGVQAAQVNRPLAGEPLFFNSEFTRNPRTALRPFHYPLTIPLDRESPAGSAVLASTRRLESLRDTMAFLARDLTRGGRRPSAEQLTAALTALARQEVMLFTDLDLPAEAGADLLAAYARDMAPPNTPRPPLLLPPLLATPIQLRVAEILSDPAGVRVLTEALSQSERRIGEALRPQPGNLGIIADGALSRYTTIRVDWLP